MAVTGLVRDGLTAAEEAHAVAALFDLKYSAAAISRATGRSKTHLAAARTAATLTGPAAQETAAYPLTIDQLATIAAFQDQPHAVAQLIAAAAEGRIDHVAAQLRAQHIEDEAVAKRCAELANQCVTVVEAEPRRYDAGPARPLDALRPAEAPIGTELTEGERVGCPGHAAYVSADYYEHDPDADDDPDDGDQADELELTVMYLCTDPDRYGHWPRHGNRVNHPRPTPADGDAADDLDEASAAAERQARRDEARKAERRALIRLNKEAPVDCTNLSVSPGRWAGRRSGCERRCCGGFVVRTKGCCSPQGSVDRRGLQYWVRAVGGAGRRRSAGRGLGELSE